ncbi:hypothetical protein K8R47_00060 [archaeon]|nr:hypothetical protein [archaeon]
MEKKNSIKLFEAFMPNRKKIIIFLIFLILVYVFGCWLTNLSTKCQCECPEGPEISYSGDKMMSGNEYCYHSLFIPFDNVYDHPNCCITLPNVILDCIIVLIIGLLFYTIYSIIEFFIKRRKS